jgi:dinuclear metal center YbgI/SA1388 family protein
MRNITDAIEKLAPLDFAFDGDNAGLIIGRHDKKISKVLLALDATDEVIKEAIGLGCEAIITHHPPIWDAIKRVTDHNPHGSRLLTLIEKKIAVYAAHTNLDFCEGGISDRLFDILELKNRESFHEDKPGVFAGRAGILNPSIHKKMNLEQFAIFVKEKLNLPHITFSENTAPNAAVCKVGIMAGDAAKPGFFRSAKAAGCDTFISADISYTNALEAKSLNINLIDATHYGSEIIFTQILTKHLKEHLPNLEVIVSKIDGQPFKSI